MPGLQPGETEVTPFLEGSKWLSHFDAIPGKYYRYCNITRKEWIYFQDGSGSRALHYYSNDIKFAGRCLYYNQRLSQYHFDLNGDEIIFSTFGGPTFSFGCDYIEFLEVSPENIPTPSPRWSGPPAWGYPLPPQTNQQYARFAWELAYNATIEYSQRTALRVVAVAPVQIVPPVQFVAQVALQVNLTNLHTVPLKGVLNVKLSSNIFLIDDNPEYPDKPSSECPISKEDFANNEDVIIFNRAIYGFKHMYKIASLQFWIDHNSIAPTDPSTREPITTQNVERYTLQFM